MAKKSILLIFFVTLLVLTYTQFRFDVRSANLKNYEVLMVKRERNIRLLSAISETLLASNDSETIDGHLADAIRVGWIDFYMITYGDEVLLYNSVRPLSDAAYKTLSMKHPAQAFWEFDSNEESFRSIRGPASKDISSLENFRFFESDLGHQRRLKAGFNLDREAYLAEYSANNAKEDRRMYILTLIIVMGAFIFSARDLLRVAKAIRTKGIRGLGQIRVLSSEAEVLQRGIAGFGEAVTRLEKQNLALKGQVLPSLRNELASGKVPPYDFHCTMVRTDINNFTHIFQTQPVDEFLTTINEFFVDCSHIIGRYDGFIYEFVGDEIIFYFKDEQHDNSFSAALACALQIEQSAEKIHQRTFSESGYPFRVKSSLSHGKIRFGPLLNGFSLAGAPLIETSRILSSVSEKSESTIHFDKVNEGRLHHGIDVIDAFRTYLKGIDGERTILRYKNHIAIDQIDAKYFSDYRADRDLIYMLNLIGEGVASKNATAGLALLSKLKVTQCGQDYLTTLSATIEALMSKQSETLSFEKSRALATIAISLPGLIPNQNFHQFEDLIRRLTDEPDPRVVANTIEAMIEFRNRNLISVRLNVRLLDSPNARVAAIALVFMGMEEVSVDVVRRLRRLLGSQDEDQAAAGIFAWEEIAQFHLSYDPVYFRTQSDFLKISECFDGIIRRFPELSQRAREAARKAGDIETNKRVAA